MTEAYSLLGLDYGDNKDIPKFLDRLPRRLAATGAAVVMVDHVPKDTNNRGRYAIGGQHKLAGIAVAYGVELVERFSRSQPGRVKVVLAKDRHGYVPGQRGSTVALVTVNPEDGGEHVTVTVDPPDGQDVEGGFRPTVLMERVSRALEANPGLSLRRVREDVKGSNHDAKRTALDVLVREGYVEVRHGPRNAVEHYPLKPYRQGQDPTVPDRAPTVPGTVAGPPPVDRARPPTGPLGPEERGTVAEAVLRTTLRTATVPGTLRRSFRGRGMTFLPRCPTIRTPSAPRSWPPATPTSTKVSRERQATAPRYRPRPPTRSRERPGRRLHLPGA